ncbi:MAG TPA: hypothetical protein VGH93_01285, partial [Solirubrobacteraceae bacterium]
RAPLATTNQAATARENRSRRRAESRCHFAQGRSVLFRERPKHAGQRRASDGAPFIEHPIEVGWLLYRAGAPDHVIAAGSARCSRETAISVAELQARFGSRIAGPVYAVSEDEGVTGYTQRKAALRQRAAAAGPEALEVFAADKVSKVRELRAAVATATRCHRPVPGSLLPPRRLEHFRHCLGMLEERLGESPLVQLLGTEFAALNCEIKAATEIPAAA